jgi:hypothetical protein
MKKHTIQHQASRANSAFPLQQQQKGGPTPKAPEAIAPPVTQSVTEVNQAKRDTQRQAGKAKGYASTVLAGETSGYGANPAAKATVLGG